MAYRIQFEMTACATCAGSGWFDTYRRCRDCMEGRVHTSAGAAAAEAYQELRRARLGCDPLQLQPGDSFMVGQRRRWERVADVVIEGDRVLVTNAHGTEFPLRASSPITRWNETVFRTMCLEIAEAHPVGATVYENGEPLRTPEAQQAWERHRAEEAAARDAAGEARRVRAEESREARLARQRAAHERAAQAFSAEHPRAGELVGQLLTEAGGDADKIPSHFLRGLVHQILQGRTLSPRQVAALDQASERRAAAAVSTHLGTIGKEITLTGQVVVKHGVTGYSGRQVMIVMSVSGSRVLTYSADTWAKAATVGQTVTVTGWVSKHNERDGAPQTVLKVRR